MDCVARSLSALQKCLYLMAALFVAILRGCFHAELMAQYHDQSNSESLEKQARHERFTDRLLCTKENLEGVCIKLFDVL